MSKRKTVRQRIFNYLSGGRDRTFTLKQAKRMFKNVSNNALDNTVMRCARRMADANEIRRLASGIYSSW